jgi:hypothetical protein
MSRVEQVTCDICGAVKKQTNGWFTVGEAGAGMFIMKLSDFDSNPDKMRIKGPAYDLCGESCVLKKVSELIGGGK